MKKLLVLFTCLMLLALLPVSAFATEKPQKQEKVSLRVYNWGEYISNGEDDTLDVVAEFEKRFPNIDVEYTTYATNEELYAKLRSGSASYDVICPSDYMISRMIEENMLEKLDFQNIPNFSDVMDNFRNPTYDPTNEYSVPYTWGTVCLIYNKTMVEEELDSWDALWDAKYANQILMFNNSRDAFGIAAKRLGYSQNTKDETQLREIAETLKEQKHVLQSYVMDEIFDKMSSGEAAIAPYYTGDGIIMAEENPDLAVALPKEGTNLFVDAMVIPKGARQKAAAETFINFMLETDIGLANTEFLGYGTPLQSVFDELDEEVKNDGLSYPDDTFLAQNCETFINLPEETNRLMQELWVDVLASDQSSVFELVFLLVVIVGCGTVTIVFLRRRKKGY